MSNAPRIDDIEQNKFTDNYRNHIINGNFDFWQRALTATSVNTAGYHAPDRFRYSRVGSQVVTISRDTDVPTAAQSGYRSNYSVSVEVTTADAAPTLMMLQHFLEGYDIQALLGKDITLSFWVKSSVTGTYSISFKNDDSSRTFVTEYTIDSADTWEKKIVSVNLEDVGTWNLDNGLGLRLNWGLAGSGSRITSTIGTWIDGSTGPIEVSSNQVNFAATTTNTFKLAQVKLNTGSSATPFNRVGKNIQEEFSMCQRYYQGTTQLGTNVNELNLFSLTNAGFGERYGWLQFPVQLRDVPSSVVLTLTSYGENGSSESVTLSSLEQRSYGMTIRCANGNTANTGGAATVSFDYEIDAEL